MLDLDLNDPMKTRVIRAHDPDERYGEDDQAEEEESGHYLDNSDNIDLQGRLLAYYQEELDRQQWNREQQSIDEDFYDHIQWTDEDAQVLRERGQAPMVLNVVAQSLNWVIGSEKRGRSDFKVLPRRKEDGKSAERKTQLLKYLADANDTPFHFSRAFEDTAKVGIGWMEGGYQDEDDSEQLYERYESWRNMLWDSAGTSMDGTDWRYVFRSKWVDYDIAKALAPDRLDVIRRAAGNSLNMGLGIRQFGDEAMDSIELERQTIGAAGAGSGRMRVRLIEAWFMVPKHVERLRGGDYHGEIYDPDNLAHKQQLLEQKAELRSKLGMRMHCAVMTTDGLIALEESPYRHNRYPFTPIWGFRRGRDNMPYGLIRGLRDIQEDINKRFSKALAILSSNKTIMEEGAVDDLDEFSKEVSRPDAIIVKKRGKELIINADRELSAAHLQLMERGISLIQQVSGVTDELMGRTTNATSGIAVERRQQQGQLSTSKLFDNLRLGHKLHGEKMLSNVEQFYTEEKQFRITNMRGTPEWHVINDGLPENDISRTKADYIISEADWRATMRQAATDQLADLISKMPPEVGLAMLDLLVEAMDIDNRDEIVRRVRQLNGQRDPDQTEPTAEDLQRQQAEQAAQQYQQAVAATQLQGEQAKVEKTQAETQATLAKAGLTQAQTVGANVGAANTALAAASTALGTLGAAGAADTIMRESGFTPATEQAAAAEQAAAVQDQQQRDAQEQQRVMAQRAADEQAQQQAQQQAMGLPASNQPPAPEGA